MHTMAPWRQTQCGQSARSCGFWLLSWGFTVLVEAHGHHGYASSSLLVDMCNWCGCNITRWGAGTDGSSASNPAQRRTVLALLRYTHLPYSVASDSKLLETSRGLGTGGPARHAIAVSSAREGEKVWNVKRCSRPKFGRRSRLWPQK